MYVPVLWSGDVYMIDSSDPSIGEGDKHCKLVKYSTSRDSWSSHAIPYDAKRRHWYRHKQAHALTTYHSKLLLIDSKVWEFDADKSAFNPSRDITLPGNWSADLEIVSAASEGDYLLTSGKSRHNNIATVLLYDGKTWIDCKSLYVHGEIGLQVLIHNHSVLLIERLLSQNDGELLYIYETSLQSLILNDPDPWQLLKSTPPIQSGCSHLSNFIVFRRHLFLLSVADYLRISWWCYLSALESWKNAGSLDLPSPLRPYDLHVHAVTLPDDSVMMINYECYQSSAKIYKLKPKGRKAVLEKLHSGMLQMKFLIRLYHNLH